MIIHQNNTGKEDKDNELQTQTIYQWVPSKKKNENESLIIIVN